MKDATGVIVSHGTFSVADTAGSSEGLQFLNYYDASGNFATSCAAATGARWVEVGMTLTNSSGITQSGVAEGLTGPLEGSLPIGQFFTNSPSNVYTASTGVSITC